MRRKRGNIQRKVVASILLVGTIPGIIVVILTYLSGINALKNSIGTNFQEMAKETADKIQIIVNREIGDAQSLALSPYIRAAVLKSNKRYEGKEYRGIQTEIDEIQQQWTLHKDNDELVDRHLLNELTDYLKDYIRRETKAYGSILITDIRGAVISATNKTADYYQGNKNWWQVTFNRGKGKVFVSGIDDDAAVQTFSVSIAVPIMSKNGEGAIGVLKMIHDVNDIFRTITNIKIGETGHANLVTSDSMLIVCPIFPPKSHRINDQLMRQISAGNPGWGVASDDAHGGKNSIIGFAPVISTLHVGPDNYGGKSWYIFVRQLPDETYAPMHTLLWKVSFLGLALIVVLPMLGFYATRRIVKPIGMLTEGAELIGSGRPFHRISIKTNDEIEQLAESFNQMADNLERGDREREGYLQQLKESEEQYKILFDNAEDSMLMVDLNGRVIAVNQRQEEVIGYSKGILFGKEFSQILYKEDRSIFHDLFERTLKGEKVLTAEVRVLSMGRNMLVMEIDLTGIKRGEQIVFVQIHLRDITEKKVLEEEVRLERDKLETIIESMGDGLDIVDKEFSIQFMNEKFLRLYGKESIGRKCYEVYTGRENPCYECPVVKGIDKIGILDVNTNRGQTFLITHSPFTNIDGTISILEIFKDITERKELEMQLIRSERLAALGRLSSTLVHDLRNPIVGIKKRLEGLQGTVVVSSPDEIRRILKDVISGSGLLLGMVNDVLDVYQNSYENIPLIISSFSIVSAMEEAIKLLEVEAEERRVSIVLHNDTGSLEIQGDKRRLQRVFINLLDNAIKFSPNGGKVDVTFEQVAEGRNDFLLLKIEDDGQGISPSELSSVFEPFHRKNGKKEGKTGTGLGLYFCKVVVGLHHGKIWAENVKGGGSAFFIKIPSGER
ncbi:MAG: PAS domain S-box protein [Nitrospinae bacterium]|nr:PAS domain S-box protein [Nitrospinota bacterium]